MKYIIFLLSIFLLSSKGFTQDLVLVENNRAYCMISIGDTADADEILAATVLQKYLLEITNIKIPILRGEIDKTKISIVLTKNHRTSLVANYSLGDDGYAIKSSSKGLYFFGGNKKGIVYAVYSFLETFLGCRMYTPYSKLVPKKARIIIPANLNIIFKPKIEHREYWFFGSFVPNEEFLLWHKLNNYKSDMNWGTFMFHTYKTYLPTQINLKNNPEYFALIDGKRDSSQLDYSNPKLLESVVNNLKVLMRSNKKITWAINPNDNERYCECSKCTAVNSAEGTKMGSVLKFVNQVSSRFPDREFSTIAYLSTQSPPKTIVPRENVRIILCNMGTVLNVPLKTYGISSVNDDFKLKMFKWKKITKKLLIWDYQALFKNIYVPFPNLYNMGSNIKFYSLSGISGVFVEGDGGLKASFSDAKLYLAAKLMWDPEVDEKKIIEEYFHWYYGKASSTMLAYYGLIDANFIKSSEPINCMSEVNSRWSTGGYFRPQMISKYRDILGDGINTSAGNVGLISKIKFELMGLDYFDLELMKKNRANYSKNDIKQKFNSFFHEVNLQNIKVSDYYLTPIETYKQRTIKTLNYEIQK
jgi:hypothetical protein